ncbi:MAG TPA: FAD-dependent oxidoreductase, partial [Gemmatimonadaceae bacterium]
MNRRQRSDAIVVGAGIVGAACAAALTDDGWRVTIVDRAFASSGTTSVGMGHVVVMDDSPEQLALTAYSERLWRDLAPELD